MNALLSSTSGSMTNSTTDRRPLTPVVVEFEHFQKSFDNKPVHRDISFTLHQGECLGLLGGSGVGKSVILRSLIGLEKPDKGRILVEGQDIVPLQETELIEVRKKVAYVFQNGALFDSMSVYENLAYPLRAHTKLSEDKIKSRVLSSLEEFGLEGCENLMPANLSGGMQKRVGLARSIILEPRVILYDEPTAGLDPFNTIRIQNEILRLKGKGVSAIFVTHDMPSVFAVCDRIALIQDGRVHSIGRREELENGDGGGILNRFVRGEEF